MILRSKSRASLGKSGTWESKDIGKDEMEEDDGDADQDAQAWKEGEAAPCRCFPMLVDGRAVRIRHLNICSLDIANALW